MKRSKIRGDDIPDSTLFQQATFAKIKAVLEILEKIGVKYYNVKISLPVAGSHYCNP
jgi:hypothetical protein